MATQQLIKKKLQMQPKVNPTIYFRCLNVLSLCGEQKTILIRLNCSEQLAQQ